MLFGGDVLRGNLGSPVCFRLRSFRARGLGRFAHWLPGFGSRRSNGDMFRLTWKELASYSVGIGIGQRHVHSPNANYGSTLPKGELFTGFLGLIVVSISECTRSTGCFEGEGQSDLCYIPKMPVIAWCKSLALVFWLESTISVSGSVSRIIPLAI